MAYHHQPFLSRISVNSAGLRLPPLTTALVAICVVIARASGFGRSLAALSPFLITRYQDAGLPEIVAGQYWRLITPVFIHFGILHITFNMLWLWQLGSAIEQRQGWRDLTLLMVVIGVTSNLAQFYATGPLFGGMSGVVYGLLGYFWMQGRFNPRFGMALQRPVVVMMLAWFVICWAGLVGNIANVAHTAGLVMGIVVGYAAAVLGRP